MQLEIITQQPATNRGLTPLLFVHGACHAAWCWENFLPFFAERGYEARALSLRGHGLSEGRERILSIPTSEYVEDVATAVNGMSALPVLIGHSLGGYVVQKYLETRVARAAVLLASVPASGSIKMLLRLTIRHPWLALKFHATRSAYTLVQTPTLAREALFSPNLPLETLNRHFMRIQDESYRVGLDTALFNLPRPDKIRALALPMLVLGAADDALFTPHEIKATAQAYNTQAEIFPDMSHDMMLDTGWQKVAERIVAWLSERGL